MKKLTTAAITAAFLASGLALPVAANAATHPATKHHQHHAVKNAPCTGLGIDIAIGPENICIPL
jgi:hypothetical protein